MEFVKRKVLLACLIAITLHSQICVGSESCGNVTGVFSDSGSVCTLTFLPSQFFRQSIPKDNYRWFFVSSSSENVQIKTALGKYELSPYQLVIRNVDKSDERDYFVDCYQQKVYLGSRWSLVVPSDVTVTSTVTTQNTQTVSSIDGQPIKEDSSNASGTDSTTVIVVALCCVVIVALISATVIIIVRKRKPRGGERLTAKGEARIESDNEKKDAESVYNEIDCDSDVPVCGAGKNSTQGSRCNLSSARASPSLHRPTNNSDPVKTKENEYLLMNECSTSTLKRAVGDTENGIAGEYAEVMKPTDSDTKSQMPTTGQKCTKPVSQSKHQTIVTNEAHCVTGVSNLEKTELQSKDKNLPEYAKVLPKSERENGKQTSDINGPEYAKAVPKSERLKHSNGKNATQTRDINGNGKEFDVTFPNIDYSNIKTSLLPKDMYRKSENPNGHTYSNLVTRQSKSMRKSRVKSRELQYAVLEHAKEDYNDEVVINNTVPGVQYATIDFEKKAFIAPVRKAPSSWYKRRQKKKGKK